MFTFKHSKMRSTIDAAVNGLLFHPDIQVELEVGGGGSVTPVYILPVEYINRHMFGFFTVKGQLVEAKLGFRQVNPFSASVYYHIDEQGNFAAGKPNDSVLYLPLALTQFSQSFETTNKRGERVALSGSPFPVFGLQGTREKYPLWLASQTAEGVMCRGIYARKDTAKLYVPNSDHVEQKLEELLKGIHRREHLPARQSRQKTPNKIDKSEIDWAQPKKIVEYLDNYVVGQDEAKKTVAVAFSNYMIQVKAGVTDLTKDNILLIGPSGVGKTYMLLLLAKKAGIQFLHGKCSGKSAAGYVDENLLSIFKQLKPGDNNTTPYGIVFYDEFDKIAKRDCDYFSPLQQDELTGWIEEAVLFGDDRKKQLNTKNLLFVFAGAFQGNDGDSLEDIIKERLSVNEKKQFGFVSAKDAEVNVQSPAQKENVLFRVMPEDIIKYGFNQELVSRIPCIGVLTALTTEEKVKILRDANDSALERQKNILQLRGYTVTVEPKVLYIIAEKCPKETGARALNSICNNMFTKIVYNPDVFAKEKLIHITPELANKLITIY